MLHETFCSAQIGLWKDSPHAHTFQGQNSGPTPPGKPPNAVQTLVVDPGSRNFEGINVGLFYSIATRATTVGTCGGKQLDSLGTTCHDTESLI
jgi:hypothetical protein